MELENAKLFRDIAASGEICLPQANLDCLPFGIVLWAARETPEYWNGAFSAIMELDPANIAGLTKDRFWGQFLPLTPPYTSGPALRRPGASGRLRCVDLSWAPWHGPMGKVVGQCAAVHFRAEDPEPALCELLLRGGTVAGVVRAAGPEGLSATAMGRSATEVIALYQEAVSQGRMVPFRVSRLPVGADLEILRLHGLEPSAALLGTHDLIAATAHELRNPLATIRGFLQILPRATPANRDRYLAVLEREVDRLGEVLADVLEQPGRTIPAMPAVNAVDAVRDALDELEPVARTHEVSIAWMSGSPPEDSLVDMPYGRLLQVLLNVLQNAVEAVPERSGQVLIQIARSAGGRHLIVRIHDNGPGIASTSDPGRPGGHGLGLVITRWLLMMHQGTLRHRRSPLGGTCAEIFLPRHGAADDAAATA